MHTLALAWGSGTRAAVTTIFLCLFSYSCATNEIQDDEADAEFEESEDSAADLLEDDSSLGFDEDGSPLDFGTGGSGKVSHPKVANAWSTKALVMTSDKPPLDKLLGCKGEVDALGLDSINEESLVMAKEKLVAEVTQFQFLYHWCFYNSMMLLDEKLQNDALGVLLEDRSTNFSKEMKSLWILALALDRASGSQTYFNYLRTRYIDLSKDFFARELEMFAPPIGNRKKGDIRNSDSKKAAGELEDDYY